MGMQCPQQPEEGAGSPGPGVPDGCELSRESSAGAARVPNRKISTHTLSLPPPESAFLKTGAHAAFVFACARE